MIKTACRIVLLLLLSMASAWAEPGNVTGWSITESNQVTFTCQFAVVKLDLLDTHVARLRYASTNAVFETGASFTVVQDWTRPEFSLTGTNPISLATTGLTVDVETTPFRVSYKKPDGSFYLTDVGTTSLVTAVSGGFTQRLASFRMASGEEYYGLGLVLGQPFSYRGTSRTLYNRRAGFSSGSMTDMAVPLMISSSNYGVFVDNTFTQVWDFTRFTQTQWRVRVNSGEMDYYFIAGDDAADVLDRYTRMTGRAPVPPRWALGYMQSRYGYRNWGQVEGARDAFRTNDMPFDALILDLYWFGLGPNVMGALRWNLSSFPDPSSHLADLKADGVRVINIHEPYFNNSNEPAKTNFNQAAALHYLAANDAAMNTPSIVNNFGFFDTAGYFDFLNPAGRMWFFGKIKPYIDDGIAAHWTDLGEPEQDDGSDFLFGGKRELEIHNVYSLLWHQALAEGYASNYPNERLYILSRSGFAGDQRFGVAHWSNDVGADWATLIAHQNAICNYGLSGMSYFGSDIGGFTGVPTDEMYVRWFQFGAFCPVFRAHGVDSKATAPYQFSNFVKDHCRNMLKLRYRLMPYIYTAARETHDTGLPMCRALPLAFPDEKTTNIVKNGTQYMFGPSILVAPMASENLTNRWVFLPDGQWIEQVTGHLISGPAILPSAPAPISDIPLYYRQDSIIPLGPYVDSTAFDSGSSRVLRVYCDTEAHYTLYDDDGNSTAYLTNEFATTSLNASRTGNVVTIQIDPVQGSYGSMPTQRVWGAELYCTSAVFLVTANGTPLQEFSDAEGMFDNNSGYYMDAAEKLLRVQIPPAPLDQTQTIQVFLDYLAPPPYEARVNAGGRPYIDRNGIKWPEDVGYTPGSFGFQTGTTNTIYTAIGGTEDDLLYQSEHLGTSMVARFDCSPGIYDVQILNAETVWTSVNQRVFNISMQGSLIFTNYDIVAAAGAGKQATTADASCLVTGNHLTVSFQFVSSQGNEHNTRASALRVCKLAELDSDADGIPDWWLTHYFGHASGETNDSSMATDDADGDHLRNLDEYVARTDPLSDVSVLTFTSVVAEQDVLRFVWPTISGKRYRILSSVDLVDWQEEAILTATSDFSTWEIPASTALPMAQYRLEVLP